MTIDEIETITQGKASPVTTYHPVVLDVAGRPVPLTLKVSAPATGGDLLVLLLSHGHGASVFLSSLHGYGPLANHFASEGFVVIQPTHLDSGTLGLREADDPDAPLYIRSRADDMRQIVERLADVEAVVPGLAGRVDHERIAAAGHSLGRAHHVHAPGDAGEGPHHRRRGRRSHRRCGGRCRAPRAGQW